MRPCINYLFISYLMMGLLLSPSSCAAKLKVVSAENKLLQYKENNQLKGPSAEIFKLLMVNASLPATVEFMPWLRAFKLASNQANTLIFSVVRTAEREDKFHWILEVSELVRAFVSLKERKDLDNLTLESAKAKLTAVVRGSYSMSWLQNQGFAVENNLYPVIDNQTAILLFLKGKVDLLYVDPVMFKHYLDNQGQNSDDIVNYHIFPETRRQSYIAINKQSDNKLVEQLAHAAKLVKQNPLYQYYYHLEPEND